MRDVSDVAVAGVAGRGLIRGGVATMWEAIGVDGFSLPLTTEEEVSAAEAI